MEQAVAIDVDIDVREIVCVGNVEKSQYDVVADGIVENGPRPPQKHQDAGTLFFPIRELFASLQIGLRVDDADVATTDVLDADRGLVECMVEVEEAGIVVEVGVVTVTGGLSDADVAKLEGWTAIEEPPLSILLIALLISAKWDDNHPSAVTKSKVSAMPEG